MLSKEKLYGAVPCTQDVSEVAVTVSTHQPRMGTSTSIDEVEKTGGPERSRETPATATKEKGFIVPSPVFTMRSRWSSLFQFMVVGRAHC